MLAEQGAVFSMLKKSLHDLFQTGLILVSLGACANLLWVLLLQLSWHRHCWRNDADTEMVQVQSLCDYLKPKEPADERLRRLSEGGLFKMQPNVYFLLNGTEVLKQVCFKCQFKQKML